MRKEWLCAAGGAVCRVRRRQSGGHLVSLSTTPAWPGMWAPPLSERSSLGSKIHLKQIKVIEILQDNYGREKRDEEGREKEAT
ncbi:hypothetical protein VNO78_25769 [Psophocarpus tetragonolobus]|uniref:Uncharacterized protein n=1 Tax=Psophocarpus tetragonolobus TaxID=3891 RepID=A0AAN9XFA0_PSOTE